MKELVAVIQVRCGQFPGGSDFFPVKIEWRLKRFARTGLACFDDRSVVQGEVHSAGCLGSTLAERRAGGVLSQFAEPTGGV